MPVTQITSQQIRNNAVITSKILDANVTLAKIVLLTKGDLISSTGAANAALPVGTNGQVLSANSAASTGLEWVSPSAGGVPLADFIFDEVPTGTVNGVNDTFTLANTPEAGTERVYVNGVRANRGAGNDYTIATNTITFESGAIPLTGDTILVDYINS